MRKWVWERFLGVIRPTTMAARKASDTTVVGENIQAATPQATAVTMQRTIEDKKARCPSDRSATTNSNPCERPRSSRATATTSVEASCAASLPSENENSEAASKQQA
jgi:hypothetical protein